MMNHTRWFETRRQKYHNVISAEIFFIKLDMDQRSLNSTKESPYYVLSRFFNMVSERWFNSKGKGKKETFIGQGINLVEGSTIKYQDLDSRGSLLH